MARNPIYDTPEKVTKTKKGMKSLLRRNLPSELNNVAPVTFISYRCCAFEEKA
jgi:hypothetical protein